MKPPDELKRGPKFLRDWLNELREFSIRTQPIKGDGILLNEMPDGMLIAKEQALAAASAVSIRPFEILKLNKDVPAKVGVASCSPISVGLSDMTGSATISGLLVEHIETDANAFDVPAIGECIYLQMDITGGSTISSVTVEHGPVWAGFPNPIELSGGVQTGYRLLLAEFTDYEVDTRPAIFSAATGDGVAQCTQMWSRGIVMINAIVDGTLCLVPMDAALDYPTTL